MAKNIIIGQILRQIWWFICCSSGLCNGVKLGRGGKGERAEESSTLEDIWSTHFKMFFYVKYTSGTKSISNIKPMETCIFVSKIGEKN